MKITYEQAIWNPLLSEAIHHAGYHAVPEMAAVMIQGNKKGVRRIRRCLRRERQRWTVRRMARVDLRELRRVTR